MASSQIGVSLNADIYKELLKIAARRTVEEGRPVSISSIISGFVEEGLARTDETPEPSEAATING